MITLADNNLSNTSTPTNSINASTINIGNSLSNNDANISQINLGSGTNVLDANQFNIGIGKTGGVLTWVTDATTTSSVTIAGTGGGNALANILVSQANSTTFNNRLSQILLAGHIATVNAGNVIIGQNSNNTVNGAQGNVTFDTGTFNAASIALGTYTGGSSAIGPTGTFVLGSTSATLPSSTATGVLNVHGSFVLGNNTATTAAASTATFAIMGGTANVGGRISVPSTSTTGATNSTLTLAGNGVLNMAGYSIGGTGTGSSGDNALTTVSLAPNSTDTVALMNLGGAGINGLGLTMNGAGLLTLDGFNTYTGGTMISSGTLAVGQASSAVMSSPLGASSGTVTVNSNLIFGSNNAMTVGNPITGSSTINVNGAGVVSLTGTGSFTGTTNINAGTLSVEGALNNTGTPGTLSISGGTLAGGGATGANVTLNSGVIIPDANGTPLTVNSLNANGGTLQFNVNGANMSKIVSANSATLSSGSLAFGLISAPTAGSYTILTSTSLSNSLSLSPQSAGRTTFTPSVSGQNLIVGVTGGPGTMTWHNNGGDGTTWNVQSQTNWTGTASTGNATQYYQYDRVTFDDTKNTNSYNVSLSGNLTPIVGRREYHQHLYVPGLWRHHGLYRSHTDRRWNAQPG